MKTCGRVAPCDFFNIDGEPVQTTTSGRGSPGSGLPPAAAGFVLRVCGILLRRRRGKKGVGFAVIQTGRAILRPGNCAVSGQEQIGPGFFFESGCSKTSDVIAKVAKCGVNLQGGRRWRDHIGLEPKPGGDLADHR